MTGFTTDICRFASLLYLISFSSLVPDVRALQCYECNSFKEEACAGSSLDSYMTTCHSEAVGCRKLHYEVDIEGNGNIHRRTVRQCAKTSSEFNCKTYYGTNGKRYKEQICECNSDKCNRGFLIMSPPFYVISSVALLAVLLFKA